MFNLENSFDTIKTQSIKRVHEIYGDDSPDVVEKRLNEELEIIEQGNYADVFIINSELAKVSRQCGFETMTKGSTASSFVCYLLGITKVNPLTPHYYCSEKHYVDFDSEYVKRGILKAGIDFEDKKCPICGKTLRKDGFNLPHETFFGLYGEKKPYIALDFASEIRPVIIDYLKNSWQGKVVRCKSGERVHPTGYMLIPDSVNIDDVASPMFGEYGELVTKEDYQSFEDKYLMVWVGEDTSLDLLHRLQMDNAIKDEDIPHALVEAAKAYQYSEIENDYASFAGVSEFKGDKARKLLYIFDPRTFSDFVKISGMMHGIVGYNEEEVIIGDTLTIENIPTTRDDIFQYLQEYSVDKETSFEVMELVSEGKAYRNELDGILIWTMLEHGVPDWYIRNLDQNRFLFPKGHCVERTIVSMLIAWYKDQYPSAFFDTYFKMYATEDDRIILNEGLDSINKMRNYIRKTGFMKGHLDCLDVAYDYWVAKEMRDF